MSRKKITIEYIEDCHGKLCYEVSCKHGKLTAKDLYEVMESEGNFGQWLARVNVPEDVPVDLYEDGDVWYLYEPSELFGEVVNDKFSEGYDACYKEQVEPLNL